MNVSLGFKFYFWITFVVIIKAVQNDTASLCDEFACHSDQLCIPRNWLCDGDTDCHDGSDETTCENAARCLGFACRNHRCIPEKWRCDGNHDCTDGSDEELCPLDTDKCLQEGFCSHQCTKTPGGYRCSCLTDYELVNRTCQAKGDDPLLFFLTGKEIRAMRLRAKDYFLVRPTDRSTALDFDPKSQHIFWIEILDRNKSSIMSAKMHERSMKTVLSRGLLIPEDIAVDYVANNLYVTDSKLHQVIVFKVDGTMCHVLHDQNVERPRSIVLDLSEGLLYWSDWGDHAAGIYRSGMDGSGRITFVSNGIGWVNGIAIDHTTNRLYWADAKLRAIEYVTLDGSSRKVVMTATVFHPYSLAVFEDTIYWSDWSSMSLESCNKFSGHRMTTLTKINGQHIMGLHVYHPVLTANVSNPCLFSSCSHMCLISPVSGFRCACPVGFELAEDSHTCKKPQCGPIHEQFKEPGTVWNLLDNVLEDSVGARRQLNCNIGYEKVGGPDIVRCQEDLMWTGTNATCKEILCDPTFKPSGESAGTEWIFLDNVKNNAYGAKRQLKCSEGYEKLGYPEIVQCQLDGSWTRTNATCREILCDPTFNPSIIPGNEWISMDDDVEKNNSYGAKRQLKCSKGYEKVGYPEIVQCQQNGSWTKTNASCREILCDPTFKPNICPGTEWISVNDVEKNNSFGAKRQIKCSTGYEKVGYPEIVQCQLDGSWTRTNATCREDTLIKVGNVVLKTETFIVTTVIIIILVLIILALIGTMIYFARKLRYQPSGKEMIVVYENPLTDGSGVFDAGVTSEHYETIHDNATAKLIPQMPTGGFVLTTHSKDGTSPKSPAMSADIV